jgi:hypothetical protein
MATTDDLLDNLMNNCKKPGDLVGENSLLNQLFRTTLQSAKQSGMTELPDNPPEEEERHSCQSFSGQNLGTIALPKK